MMVIFLVGLVSMILMRTLRKDYARYSKEEDGDDMVKTVHVVVLGSIVYHSYPVMYSRVNTTVCGN